MDADPDNRPTAEEVLKTIDFWKDIEILETNNPNYYYSKEKLDELEKRRENYSKEQLDELGKLREIFDKMDQIKYDPSTIPGTVHPNAVYTSRILKFTNLPQSINSNKATIISNNHGNYLIYLITTILIITKTTSIASQFSLTSLQFLLLYHCHIFF